MEKITSFTINHLKLLPGVYVSRVDYVAGNPVTTFDLRMTAPNREPVMNTAEMHTIEHLGATFLRNDPEFGEKVGRAVVSGEADCGILICGTGVGISMAANKVKGVRCGVCSDVTTAHLIKEHNNANIIAFGARIVGNELAKDIVKSYLEAEFLGGRHQKRIDMITEIEEKEYQ